MGVDKNENNNSTVWRSGIKYTEEDSKRKISKNFVIIIITILAALIGGIIASIIVINVYSESINMYKSEVNEYKRMEQIGKGDITKASQKVGPSIVGIIKTPDNWMGEALGDSLGSGVIFDDRGYILTNQHIISGVKNITVILPGGRHEIAEVIGQDFKSDIAILKINVPNLKAVKFRSEDDIKTGETVIGIGNPYGEEFSGLITSGVISAINKVIKVDDRAYKIYQTDMNFGEGNSGGAVVNDSGEVIGIINNKLNSVQEGSYIMPISEAKPIIDKLMKDGKLITPFLGVKTFLIDAERSEEYGVPVGLGVVEVVEGTSAEKYGIQKGDIILNVNGGRVSKITDITDLLEGKVPGDKITIKVYRDGKTIDINAALIKLSLF